MRKGILVAVLTILLACVTHVPATAGSPDDENAVMFLVWCDYEVVNQKLYERCLKEYPETASSFKEGISYWGEKNYPALKKLRLLYRDVLVAKGMTTADKADAAILENVKEMTTGNLESFMSLPSSEMRKLCVGYVDEVLSRLDFASILDRYDAKMKRSQQ